MINGAILLSLVCFFLYIYMRFVSYQEYKMRKDDEKWIKEQANPKIGGEGEYRRKNS